MFKAVNTPFQVTESFRSLSKDIFPSIGIFPDAFPEAFDSSECMSLSAMREDSLLGVCSLHLDCWNGHRVALRICGLVAAPNRTKNGILRALIDEAALICRAHGAEVLWCRLKDSSDSASIETLSALGFRQRKDAPDEMFLRVGSKQKFIIFSWALDARIPGFVRLHEAIG